MSASSIGKLVGAILVVLIALITGARVIVTVPYGTVELQTQFGALTGVVYDEGLHFKAPWQGVKSWDVKTLSYEASSHPDTSKADFTDYPVDGLTQDGQQVLALSYTVLFNVSPSCVLQTARQYGTLESVVENVVKSRTRNLARTRLGLHTAEDLYANPDLYESRVRERLAQALGESCVNLVDFLVRKPDLDPNYLDAIERQQIAQEDIETAAYRALQAEHDKQRSITEAEARRESDILKAEAEAQAIRLRADAEAYAIEVQGQALAANPSILNWQFVQTLAEVDYMILPADGVTPLIPIPPQSQPVPQP